MIRVRINAFTNVIPGLSRIRSSPLKLLSLHYSSGTSTALKYKCGEGLLWDRERKLCDWAGNVKCGIEVGRRTPMFPFLPLLFSCICYVTNMYLIKLMKNESTSNCLLFLQSSETDSEFPPPVVNLGDDDLDGKNDNDIENNINNNIGE